MSSEATRSELVVGVDGSVASYAAVSWAAREATMRRLPALKARKRACPRWFRSDSAMMLRAEFPVHKNRTL